MKLDATYSDGQIRLTNATDAWHLSVDESLWVSSAFGLETWTDSEYIRSVDDHHSTPYRKLDSTRWISASGVIVDSSHTIARTSLGIVKITAQEFYKTAKPWAGATLISAVRNGRFLPSTHRFFREGDSWTNTVTGETIPHQYLVNGYTDHTVIKG